MENKIGEGVSSEVEGQSLLDSAYRCDLFEVVVTLLIGWYWEQPIAPVFCEEFVTFFTKVKSWSHRALFVWDLICRGKRVA